MATIRPATGYRCPVRQTGEHANQRNNEIIIQEKIAQSIFSIRNSKVMMDSVLAEVYGVPTKVLNQAVKRNQERFPDDFMFQLTDKEWENLRSQFVTSIQPA